MPVLFVARTCKIIPARGSLQAISTRLHPASCPIQSRCLAACFSSCTGVHFYKDEALTQKTGLKYDMAKAYILVSRTEAKDQPVEVSIVYLPDLAHPVFVKPTSGLGSSDLKLTLWNGMLASFGVTTDPVAGETLKALNSLLTGGVEALGKLAQGFGLKEPQAGTFKLYEVCVAADKTTLKKIEVR
jgi:hypothetical protein